MYKDRLLELQDLKFKEFHSKLIPTVPAETVIGIKVPPLRQLARKVSKEDGCETFLSSLPHDYYEENMLHGLIIAQMKDYSGCIREIDRFLPYVDNWAVCDSMRPKVLAKNKEDLLKQIKRWVSSKEEYTCRFGIEALMQFFLDEDFREEYLEIPAGVQSEQYYVQMMTAWFFATALSKQWDAAFPYIENKKLAPWIHNKSIQKACESYMITPEQKAVLRKLKVKIAI